MRLKEGGKRTLDVSCFPEESLKLRWKRYVDGERIDTVCAR